MRITITAKYPKAEVRELVRFAARGVYDMNIAAQVRGATVDRRPRGRAFTCGRVQATIPNPGYFVPMSYHNHGQKRCKPFMLYTWQEALVYVMAHEFAHIAQYREYEKKVCEAARCGLIYHGHRASEAKADAHGQKMLAAYRKAAKTMAASRKKIAA